MNSSTRYSNVPNPHQLSRTEKRLLAWGKRSGRREGEKGILLEGATLIQEALYTGLPVWNAWYTEDFAIDNHALIQTLAESECRLRSLSKRGMKEVSDLETSPGIAAITPEPGFIRLTADDPYSLIVVLAKIQDPGNLGAVIRVCDYFGVNELWLGPESADPFSSKALRGAMGASFRLTVFKVKSLSERIIEYQKAGASVWASVVHDEPDEFQISTKGKRILCLGSEAHGLPNEIKKIADHSVRIPGSGKTESLNLAVAAGILIYTATVARYK